MSQQQLPPGEIQESRELSEEGKLVTQIFSEMRSKQLDFLDESGKSLIERIATFLTILFAVTAFSNTFPPPYLKGNLTAKVTVIVTLVLYLLAMGAAILAIQPRMHAIPLYNVTRMGEKLQTMTRFKIRCLRVAGILFAIGSLSLAVLIIAIIWNA